MRKPFPIILPDTSRSIVHQNNKFIPTGTYSVHSHTTKLVLIDTSTRDCPDKPIRTPAAVDFIHYKLHYKLPNGANYLLLTTSSSAVKSSTSTGSGSHSFTESRCCYRSITTQAATKFVIFYIELVGSMGPVWTNIFAIILCVKSNSILNNN